MLGDQVLDLGGEHVLAARDDHVVRAALDEQAPVVVEVADVAGGHQPVDHVLAAAAGVPLEEHLVANEDASPLAPVHFLAIGVEELDDRAAGRLAGGAGSGVQVGRRRDRRPRDLGRAVEVVEDVAERVEPALDDRWGERRA